MSAVKQQPTPATPRPRRRRAPRGPLIVVLVAPLLVLWPVVRAEFIPLDDPANVSRNERLNPPTLRGVAWFWTNPHLNMYAPLTYTAWAGVARLAWVDAVDNDGTQLNPYVFHAANLLVHLVNTLLVYALLRELITHHGAREDPIAPAATPWAACAGTLLFALHPMQVEPVAWVTGFRDVLAAMFALGSLLAYLSHAKSGGSKSRKSYVLACACLLAALLCKPTTVVVPLLAAALDWGVLRRPLRDVAKPVAGMLLLVIPFVLLATRFQSAALTYTPPLWARPIIALDAVAFYLMKLALPLRLGLDYGRSPQWLLEQRGVVWLGWVLVLLAAGAVMWMLRRHRAVIAGAAVFVAALLPVLGLTKFDFQHHSTVADRYVYLGMPGPALLLALLLRRSGRNTAVVAAVAAVVLVLFAARSHVQARAWQSGESIYRATLAANPHSLIANRGLGGIADDKRREAVMAHFREPTGRHLREAESREREAEQYFLRALATRPNDPVTNFHLGNLYLATNRPAQAVPHLRIAAAVHREPWVATNYANALARSGDLLEARRVLERAIATSPSSAELHATLAAVLFRQGDRAGAAEHYRAALRINPTFALAAQELAALERATTTTTSSSSPSTQSSP